MRLERWRYRGLWYVYTALYWLRRRFTTAGQLVLIALVVSALVGFDTDQNVAYQMFTFMLALTAAAMLQSLFFRDDFEVRRTLPRFGTAGKPLPYTVSVRSRSGEAQRGLSLLEEAAFVLPTFDEYRLSSPPPREEQTPLGRLTGNDRWQRLLSRSRVASGEEHPLADIPPRGSAAVTLELTPRRRGKLRLDAASVARPGTLGLYKSLRPCVEERSVLVLPKRYPVPRVSLPGLRRYQSGGIALSSSVGDSQEFMSLRDYRPGDPPKRVHWKSLAKTDKLIVKEYQDEYFVRHALVLDTFARPGRGAAFEEAVSVAASFACSVLTQESLLDLLFVGGESYCITAGRGLGGPDKLLEVLACVERCEDKPFTELDHAVSRRHAALSGCISVLLAWDEERRAFIRRLGALGVPVLAVVVAEPVDPPIDEPGVHRLEVGRIAEGLAALPAGRPPTACGGGTSSRKGSVGRGAA
ncbi:MAG: DUF58 domain-containing protein [Elusimicrobiota bacterium]